MGQCHSLLLHTVLSMVLVASRHSARRSGDGANLQAGPVRTCAPCRQYPFERAAAGPLQVPKRQKEDLKFGGFAFPGNPPHSP